VISKTETRPKRDGKRGGDLLTSLEGYVRKLPDGKKEGFGDPYRETKTKETEWKKGGPIMPRVTGKGGKGANVFWDKNKVRSGFKRLEADGNRKEKGKTAKEKNLSGEKKKKTEKGLGEGVGWSRNWTEGRWSKGAKKKEKKPGDLIPCSKEKKKISRGAGPRRG